MEKINMRNKTGMLVVTGIVLAAALSRLLPHPWNFTPVGAMALFGAAYYANRWIAFLAPLAALWISDLVLNNTIHATYYQGFTLFSSELAGMYVAFAVMVLIGVGMLRKLSIKTLAATSVLGVLGWWICVDFFSWLGNPIYAKNLAGLITCYAAGFPYFLDMLLSTVLYGALLFGVFEWIRRKAPSLAAFSPVRR